MSVFDICQQRYLFTTFMINVILIVYLERDYQLMSNQLAPTGDSTSNYSQSQKSSQSAGHPLASDKNLSNRDLPISVENMTNSNKGSSLKAQRKFNSVKDSNQALKGLANNQKSAILQKGDKFGHLQIKSDANAVNEKNLKAARSLHCNKKGMQKKKQEIKDPALYYLSQQDRNQKRLQLEVMGLKSEVQEIKNLLIEHLQRCQQQPNFNFSATNSLNPRSTQQVGQQVQMRTNPQNQNQQELSGSNLINQRQTVADENQYYQERSQQQTNSIAETQNGCLSLIRIYLNRKKKLLKSAQSFLLKFFENNQQTLNNRYFINEEAKKGAETNSQKLLYNLQLDRYPMISISYFFEHNWQNLIVLTLVGCSIDNYKWNQICENSSDFLPNLKVLIVAGNRELNKVTFEQLKKLKFVSAIYFSVRSIETYQGIEGCSLTPESEDEVQKFENKYPNVEIEY